LQATPLDAAFTWSNFVLICFNARAVSTRDKMKMRTCTRSGLTGTGEYLVGLDAVAFRNVNTGKVRVTCFCAVVVLDEQMAASQIIIADFSYSTTIIQRDGVAVGKLQIIGTMLSLSTISPVIKSTFNGLLERRRPHLSGIRRGGRDGLSGRGGRILGETCEFANSFFIVVRHYSVRLYVARCLMSSVYFS
jgi:hypothetical protein